jgi:phage gp36-like protein
MIYVTTDEVLNYLPERLLGALSNDIQGDTSPNNEIIESAIVSAENMVNSYLAKHYRVPVKAKDGSIPFAIKNLVFTITKYNLHTRASILSPEISEEYNNTISYMSKIARGDITMPALTENGDDTNREELAPIGGSNYRGLFDRFGRV